MVYYFSSSLLKDYILSLYIYHLQKENKIACVTINYVNEYAEILLIISI